MAKRGRKFLRGKIWWIQYWFNGKDRRESTHSTNESVADRLLTKRIAAKEGETLTEAAIRPLRFKDLQAAIERDYRKEQNKSFDRMQDAFQALAAKFAGWKTTAITDVALEEYVDKRLEEGRAHATILYELRMLRRAFRLAKRPCPAMPSLSVKNVRKEFFEEEEFQAVVHRLPIYFQPVMVAACLMGWRTQSELLPLTWKHVNWKLGTVSLLIGETKNDEPRVYPFGDFPELKAIFEARWQETERLQRERGIVIPWVFFRVERKAVKPIKSYTTAWNNARVKAGLPDRWVHDFRRCGARSLRQAGVAESVAMTLIGHKTPSIFRRYGIVDDKDLRVGVGQLAAFHAQQAGVSGTKYGTVSPFPVQKKEQHG